MDMRLDPSIHPDFQTFFAEYESTFGKVEVWACVSSDTCGITQKGKSFTQDRDNEHIILLSREELLKLQVLVNKSVELLEKGNVETGTEVC